MRSRVALPAAEFAERIDGRAFGQSSREPFPKIQDEVEEVGLVREFASVVKAS